MSKEQQEELKKPIKVDYPEFNIEDPIEYQKELDKITDQYFINASTTRTLKNIREVLVNKLRKKYNLTNGQLKAAADIILKIHGLHEDNFDGNLQFSKFLNAKNSNEVSIDGNANKTETGIKALMVEASLADRKLIGFDQLYRVMVELYGREKAKELSGSMYDFSLAIADSTNLLIPYCYAADFSKIVTIGREFGKEPSGPAKSLSTYCNVVCDTVRELSCHLAGAVAISTFFLDSAHLLIYKERIPLDKVKTNRRIRHYITDCYQHVVYSLNHASRDAAESPFTNISCFDEYKLKTLVEDMSWYFPMKIKAIVDNNMDEEVLGHKMTEEEWKNFVVDYAMSLQELYIDLFNKGNPLKGGLQFAFPVTTMNFSVKYNDKGEREVIEPNRLLDYATKKDIKRYNIYVSEGTKVASCCLAATTKVLYRIDNKVSYGTVHQLYDIVNAGNNEKVEIMGSNGFVEVLKGFEIKNPTNELLKITLKNGLVISVTRDHPSVKIDSTGNLIELKAEDLKVKDLLPVSKNIDYDTNGGYRELGRFIGLFGAEGQFDNRRSSSIAFCFHTQEKELQDFVSKFALNNFGCKSRLDISPIYENSCRVEIQGNVVHGLMKDFFIGELCTEKRLKSRIFNMSKDFRLGFLEGFIEGDGYTKDNTRSDYGSIHIANKELAHDLVALANSINIKCSIRKGSNGNDYTVNILHNDKLKLKPLSDWHNGEGSKQKSTVLNDYDKYYGIEIDSIEVIKTKKDMNVYDFTVNTDEHLFQIANGIITHNCRLINDTEMSELASSVNSFGGSSISLGSDRVVTVDLLRIAFECKDYEDYKRILKLRIDHCAKILKAHRVLIMKLKSLGTQPFISNGWINFGRMFGTFGCIGYLEADKTLKKRFDKDFDYMKDFMIYFNQEVENKNTEVDENGNKLYPFPKNIEQIPGESMAVKIAKVDKILYPTEEIPTVLANQFVSLWEDKTIYEKMDRDGELNKLLTGGGICHIQCSEKLSSHQAKKLIKYAAKSGCDHFAINGVYMKCNDCNTVVESSGDTCPKCGGKHVEHYTRVIGFFSKVENWIPERQKADFPNRKFVDIKTIDSK